MTSSLGNEWHISSTGSDILTENNSVGNKQQIYNVALNTDLKEICKPVLHELTNNETPKVVLQIHKIRNISAPKANEDSQAAPRLLKLTLTDGDTYINALEFSPIGNISLKATPPGTKLLLEKVKISAGYLLLTPQNCKVLGGQVSSLIEKWELTKTVQRNRRNYNDNEDFPPPWVNFGTKIKTSNQENNFKSLTEKGKDPKETSEFDQQRQDAIAEASSGAVRKVFSGRVKQNVQVQSANNNNTKLEKLKDKKDTVKPKGKNIIREKEIEEKPQKPSAQVSLFSFLEDKLPTTNAQDNVYQSQPNKSAFKDTESFTDDENKFDYKKKKFPIPKQFEKPDYSKNQGKSKNDNLRRDDSYAAKKYSSDNSQKKSIDNSFSKSKPYIYNNQNSNINTEQKPYYNPQKTNNYQVNNNQQSNFNQYRQKFYPQQNISYSSHPNSYPQLNNYYSQPNHSYSVQNNENMNFNSNIAKKQPDDQRQNVQNDVNHITQEVHKLSVNSQFASRSLRQHLNLDWDRKKEDNPVKNEENSGSRMNIGDEIMAKYWEDGKYYNATIISITDKTFAVKFKGYGNIEEILKSDCHPISNSNNRSNFHQQPDRSNKYYSGSTEYRRRNYK